MGCIMTRCLNAMPALIGKKQPLEPIIYHLFFHPDKLIGLKGEILGILICADIFCFFGRQIVPLLTGNLTSPAGCTDCRIY